MKRFLVLYRAPTAAVDQMKNASPEQAKAGMDAWMAWASQAGAAIVELGAPLGHSQRMAMGESESGHSDIVGYSILQAESSRAIGELLVQHPHLAMPGFSIQFLEALPMPGM